MAARCATIEEFLRAAPEFLNAGEQSDGTLTVLVNPSPGDTLTLATRFGVPIVTESYVGVAGAPSAGEFEIGVDAAATAANIATALNGGALAAASAAGTVVSILTANGPIGSLTLTSSDEASMLWDESPMTPGTAQVQFALDCTCSQINIECWGVKADCGHIYLAAHFLAMQGWGSGQSGAVSSKSIDKLSISYAVSPPSDGDLGRTKWGSLYMQMRKSLFVPGIAARAILPRPPRIC
jgi:hypothetical protein